MCSESKLSVAMAYEKVDVGFRSSLSLTVVDAVSSVADSYLLGFVKRSYPYDRIS